MQSIATTVNRQGFKLLLFSFLLLQQLDAFSQADLIFYNGKIFTADKKQLWVEALAIKGEHILAAGKRNEVMELKVPSTRMVDLDDHIIVPGFNDAHHHEGPSFHNRTFDFKNGAFAPTVWEEARDSVLKIVKEVPSGELISATINPDLLSDPRARKKTLDSIAPNNPVIFFCWTGHQSILNSAALQFIGYNDQTNFAGGMLERDNENKLTGVIREYGEFQIWSRLAARLLTEEQIVNDIRNDYQVALSLGITTDQVMTTNLLPQTFLKIFKENDFGCRVRLIAFPFTNEAGLQFQEWENTFHQLNLKNYISGVKLILDGSPVDRDACMRTPYSSQPGNYGHLDFSEPQIKAFMQFCLNNNQQIILHAVGDSAVVTLIRAMRSLHPDTFWKNKRVRIEHGEFSVVNKTDFKILHDLGIIIVQNPMHFSLPSVLAEMNENYKGKTNYLQGIRSYLENGIPLAIGSDGPINPFLNIMMATLHPDNPKEAISVEQAVIAYTHGSAYAEFKEKEKGTLTKGKVADLAVLSQNIFTINPNRLPATTSILTLVGGKVVYDKHLLK